MIVTSERKRNSPVSAVDYVDSFTGAKAFSDARDRHSEPPFDFFQPAFVSRPHRKEQLVIFSSGQGIRASFFSGKHFVRRRERQHILPNFRADRAGLTEVAQVLKQPVAHVDHRPGQSLARQQPSRSESGVGKLMTADEICRRVGSILPLFFIHPLQSEGGVTQSSGDVEIVARYCAASLYRRIGAMTD
jgi:hypothetical protein